MPVSLKEVTQVEVPGLKVRAAVEEMANVLDAVIFLMDEVPPEKLMVVPLSSPDAPASVIVPPVMEKAPEPFSWPERFRVPVELMVAVVWPVIVFEFILSVPAERANAPVRVIVPPRVVVPPDWVYVVPVIAPVPDRALPDTTIPLPVQLCPFNAKDPERTFIAPVPVLKF